MSGKDNPHQAWARFDQTGYLADALHEAEAAYQEVYQSNQTLLLTFAALLQMAGGTIVISGADYDAVEGKVLEDHVFEDGSHMFLLVESEDGKKKV